MAAGFKRNHNKENASPRAKRAKSSPKAGPSKGRLPDSDSDNDVLVRRGRPAPKDPNQLIDLTSSSPPPPPPQPVLPLYPIFRNQAAASTSSNTKVANSEPIVISDDEDGDVEVEEGKDGHEDLESEDGDVKEEEGDEEVEEFELTEDNVEITLDMMKRLATTDETITEAEKKRMKKVEGAVDRWIISHVDRQYAQVTTESKELAAICIDVVKRIVAKESRGLFVYNDGRLRKAFPFKSSFRDVFLEDHDGDQLVDRALALLLDAGSEELSDAFYRLYEAGDSGTLDLGGAFEDGIPGRDAKKEVGLYLRKIPGYDYYVGISRDIAQRQRQHNAGKAGEQGNSRTRKALAGRPAADTVISRRLASFGKTGLSEIPQPVLHCIETLLIGSARLSTSSNSIQINMVDSPPYAPPRPPSNTQTYTAKGAILAKVWKGLYDYFQNQLDDFELGKYWRNGLRPVPVGVDGMSRAELEARKIIIPIIRYEKVGLSWVYGNLFREETFEKDGEIISQSKYTELRLAKSRYPIPVHAFYQPKNVRQHRDYISQGIEGIPLGHYPMWSSKLGDYNGYKVYGSGGDHGGLFGRRSKSRLSERQLQETLAQAWELFKAVFMMGINGNWSV